MQFEFKHTKDGTPTIYLPHLDEHYHSIHGAETESMHVYIKNGLLKKLNEDIPEIHILEVGLGTGLNVLLTLQNSLDKVIHYTALEPYPLDEKIYMHTHFTQFMSDESYAKIHQSEFEEQVMLSENFSFLKKKIHLEEFYPEDMYNLIYFDAFGPRVQPDIWSIANFQKLYSATLNTGVLVTYCSKGEVRRAMLQAGFKVEKLAGPPGKREMLRAVKIV